MASLPPLSTGGFSTGALFFREAGSLYEYLVPQIAHAASVRSDTVSRLNALLTRPHCLNDLVRFTSEEGMRQRFKLVSRGTEVVSRFLNTIELMREKSDPWVVSAAIYLLGDSYIREVFADALVDPVLRRNVEKALQKADEGPFPLLLMDRLLHVLASKDHAYKVREIFGFPWDLATGIRPQAEPNQIVDGSFDTGFTWNSALTGILRRIAELRRSEPAFAEKRRNHWAAICEKFSMCEGEVTEEMLFQLLLLQPSSIGKEIGKEIRTGRIQIQFQSSQELGQREAFHLLPEENGGTDALILTRTTLDKDKMNWKRHLLKLAGTAVHEGRHVLQARRHGGEWAERNLVPAEMEGLAAKALLFLENGDTSLFDDFSSRSPFGYVFGLRNSVERTYLRLLSS